MQIDFPGVMTPFGKVQNGDFFVYFDDKRPCFAMKIFDASLPQKNERVLSFSTAAHPTMTPPTALPPERFWNRDVCVVRDVVVRPPFEMAKLQDGTPLIGQPGPVMFASDGVFIRAWPDKGQGTIDVDLRTGAALAAEAHPGSIWIDDWEIVLASRAGETILCTRGKPKAT